MKRADIRKQYTRVVDMNCGWSCSWSCYLQIDNQSFCVAENKSKTDANWYARQLSIALEKLINSVKD